MKNNKKPEPKTTKGLIHGESDRVNHLGEILELHMRGYSNRKIGEMLDLKSQKVASVLHTFKQDYLKTLAIRGIIPRYGHLDESIDEINQPFLDKLTPSDSGALSNEEMLYCTIYVSTGNSREAVVRSGLDVGMEKGASDTKSVYDNNLFLRSEFLKRKKNVQEEIRRQQREREEIREITKNSVLQLHLDLIEQYREDDQTKHKSAIVKLLDQVCRIEGYYTGEKSRDDLTADDLLTGMLLAMEEDKADDGGNSSD